MISCCSDSKNWCIASSSFCKTGLQFDQQTIHSTISRTVIPSPLFQYPTNTASTLDPNIDLCVLFLTTRTLFLNIFCQSNFAHLDFLGSRFGVYFLGYILLFESNETDAQFADCIACLVHFQQCRSRHTYILSSHLVFYV